MWVSTDGRVNTVRVNPKNYLSKRLRKRIDKLPDIEKVRLDLQMTELCNEILSTMADHPAGDDESSYENVALPADLGLDADPGVDNLASSLAQDVRRTPRRWIVERAHLVPHYVTDHGPKFKTWSKLVDKIREKG